MRKASIEDLIQADLGIPKNAIYELADSANSQYSRIDLGKRMIDAPSNELKLVQCWISDFLRAENPISEEFVAAYERDCSIVKNARLHCENAHIFVLDIQSFFHSCSYAMVKMVFERLTISDRRQHGSRPLTRKEISILAKLCCYKEVLSVGAPSSPALANRIMLPVDKEIIQALGSGFAYSRYSDDITISSNEWIDEAKTMSTVESALAKHDFQLNHRKTHIMGRGCQRRITGVYIQPDGSLSMGSKRKKQIKHYLYEYLCKGKGEPLHILGLIYFAIQVEPSWAASLIAKYANYGSARGIGVMNALRQGAEGF